VPLDPRDPKSPTLPCVAIQLRRTKTGDADDAGRVLLVGPPVEALREWLQRADISRGPVFRAIDRWEAIEERGADAAVDQPDREAPLRDGGARGEGVFGARTAGWVFDRSSAAGRCLARGNAAIPASVRATGSQVLQ